MPAFLSPGWVEAFDAAVRDAELPVPGDGAGLVASSGRFTVAEEVTGGPDGDVVLVLSFDRGTLRLRLADPGERPDADVTVALTHEDAAALSTGELAPAAAVTQGRIRVRGDLSVLVAAQELLAAARPLVAGLADGPSA